jgi:hypothetical protein
MSLRESGGAGLLIMPCELHGGSMIMTHLCNIPAPCCPVSKNPKSGSTISFTYTPNSWVVEVYSLESLLKQFQGGYKGNNHYPAERNMEGMCQLLCKMVSDALGIEVSYRADINLDCGGMTLTGKSNQW